MPHEQDQRKYVEYDGDVQRCLKRWGIPPVARLLAEWVADAHIAGPPARVIVDAKLTVRSSAAAAAFANGVASHILELDRI